jgi:hypothetical protein
MFSFPHNSSKGLHLLKQNYFKFQLLIVILKFFGSLKLAPNKRVKTSNLPFITYPSSCFLTNSSRLIKSKHQLTSFVLRKLILKSKASGFRKAL